MTDKLGKMRVRWKLLEVLGAVLTFFATLANVDGLHSTKKLFKCGFPRVIALGIRQPSCPPLVGDPRCASQRGLRDSFPSPVAVDEEARNPPVGRSHIQLAVRCDPVEFP